jgi:hypothetical protein
MHEPVRREDTPVTTALGHRHRPAIHAVHLLLHIENRVVDVRNIHRPVHHVRHSPTSNTAGQPVEQMGTPEHSHYLTIICHRHIARPATQRKRQRLGGRNTAHIPQRVLSNLESPHRGLNSLDPSLRLRREEHEQPEHNHHYIPLPYA